MTGRPRIDRKSATPAAPRAAPRPSVHSHGAAVSAEGGELSGPKAGYHEASVIGRRRAAEQRGGWFGRLVGPERSTIGGGKGEQAVVDRDQEHPSIGDRRCRAAGHADVAPPFRLSVRDIQGDELRQAVDSVERGLVDPQAAADIGAVSILGLGVGAPKARAVRQAEGADNGIRIHGEDGPAGDHGLCENHPPVATAFADFRTPQLREMIVGGKVPHQVCRIASSLWPAGVANRRRQNDLRRTRIDTEAAAGRKD